MVGLKADVRAAIDVKKWSVMESMNVDTYLGTIE